MTYTFLGAPNVPGSIKAVQKCFEVGRLFYPENATDCVGSSVYHYPKHVRPFSRSGRSYDRLPQPCRGNHIHAFNQHQIADSFKPYDIPRQSLPFSYVTLSVAPTDGSAHGIKFYTDISAEWVSGDNNLPVNWTTTVSDNIIIHQTQLLEQKPFSENNDHIQRELP